MKIVLWVLVQCMTIFYAVGLCRDDCASLRNLYEAIPCTPSPACNGGICARAYKCPYIDKWPKGKCYLNGTYYNNGDVFSVNYYNKQTRTIDSCLHYCASAYSWMGIIPINCPSTHIAKFNAVAKVCSDTVRYDQQYVYDYNLPIYVDETDSCPLSWLSAYFAPPSNAVKATERTCRAGNNSYVKGTIILICYNTFVFKCKCGCPPFLRCVYLSENLGVWS